MADDRVVSKIVSSFFLETCQSGQQCTDEKLRGAVRCYLEAAKHSSEGYVVIPQTTGSVAELYINPMYRCFGDFDTTEFRNDILAIPAGYPPPVHLPEEFHTTVTVYGIVDSGFPGYVYLVESYLLNESVEEERFDAVQCQRRYRSVQPVYGGGEGHFRHGLATAVETRTLSSPFAAQLAESGQTSTDYVECVRCLSWPTQGADWPTRHKTYGWPDSATVDRVVSNGCDVVRVAHRLCREDSWMNIYQHRLSFSRAEIVLLNSWMLRQQIVYHMLRIFIKVERLTYTSENTGTELPSNYNIKTLMLWACELKPSRWWLEDLNVVEISVELLHTLAVWLADSRCPHYFISNCNLFDHVCHNSDCSQLTASRLLFITESSLAHWFINKYLVKCLHRCPENISRLFNDVSTGTKLNEAVSAVVEWKASRSLLEYATYLAVAQTVILAAVNRISLTLPSCLCLRRELVSTSHHLSFDFIAVVFLHVAHKMARYSLNDYFLDVLTTTCLQSDDVRRCLNARHSSLLSLSQAAKLMKVVANSSRSTVQLTEIELSKAYLYRALRCKDSDNHSIYCLANVYLAVLYYATGQYQTAIDHCTLVLRSQDHSQCSSHVVEGELLPKVDDDIDNVLGLAVLYQHIRTAALNQKQRSHVSVLSMESLTSYLYVRCLSAAECHQFTQTMSPRDIVRCQKFLCDEKRMFTTDLLLLSFLRCMRHASCNTPLATSHQMKFTMRCLNTSKLIDLLHISAVEHLTVSRQLEAQLIGSEWTTVTTDFESLYAYKLGDYQRCLQLATHNVHSLIGRVVRSCVLAYPELIQLMDDDIASLTGLTLLVQPSCRIDPHHVAIPQLSLSLYLMTQCQMKLHHSVTSLAQTLDYIEVARRDPEWTKHILHQSLLKLTERKILKHLSQTN